MEVPRWGVQLEIQLLAYTTATAMPDLSHVCNLHHNSQQCWILIPPSEARDPTESSWILGKFFTSEPQWEFLGDCAAFRSVPNHPVKERVIKSLSTIHRWGNWGPERGRNLPKVSQQGSEGSLWAWLLFQGSLACSPPPFPPSSSEESAEGAPFSLGVGESWAQRSLHLWYLLSWWPNPSFQVWTTSSSSSGTRAVTSLMCHFN